MARTDKYSQAQVIGAVRACGGLINEVAKRLAESSHDKKCSWATVKRYIDNYPKVREAYESASEMELDLSEARLFDLRDNARSPSVQLRAVIFHLTHKGRSRGYGKPLASTPSAYSSETIEDRREELHRKLHRLAKSAA